MPSMNPDSSITKHGTRRRVLRSGLGLASAAALGGCGIVSTRLGGSRPAFEPVAVAATDKVVLPAGYGAIPLAAWGEPVGLAGAMPAWQPDAGNNAADQALQIGTGHAGVQYLALEGSRRGLLVLTHAATDDGLLHVRGTLGWSADKVKKAQAARGVSVVEVALDGGVWRQVRPSKLARRVTATTPMAISGPAAGHRLLRTAADPAGRRVLGTLSTGAIALTPWGTCLVAETAGTECFATADQPTAHERRWGLQRAPASRWHEHDERFDTVRHPSEPNRHGWVVEFDPTDPRSTPVKRTAIGRAAHAGVWTAVSRDGRAVVYAGGGARSEYLYKFVSRDRIKPSPRANADLLDQGTLYVARFNADGSGRWLALNHGQGPLGPAGGFVDAGDVLIKSRQAGDALAATPIEAMHGLAIDTSSGWVYAALAIDAQRAKPGPVPLLRWRDEGDFAGERFSWNEWRGGETAARSPGAFGLDGGGRLWLGASNEHLLASDTAGGEPRRFLCGPAPCALAGLSWTPDGRTMFVNVQHPGRASLGASDSTAPRKLSNWPDFKPDGRPRSATLAIRRDDGGLIGG